MNKSKQKTLKRERRHRRVRAKVKGTAERPRLSVFRSNRYIAAQLIDDERGHTLAAVNTKTMKGKTPRERARAAGEAIAEKAQAKKIKKVVFDRGGYKYIGNIHELAEGARSAGLTF